MVSNCSNNCDIEVEVLLIDARCQKEKRSGYRLLHQILLMGLFEV